jgi:hypothetical protein
MEQISRITLFMAILVFFTNETKAQHEKKSKKLFQEITYGVIMTGGGGTTTEKDKPPVEFEKSFNFNVEVKTPWTAHSFMWNPFDNSISNLNAFLLPHGLDAYIVYSRSLKEAHQYAGIGLEKVIWKLEKNKGGINLLIYSELGTNFEKNTKYSFGLLLSGHGLLWKRKSSHN